MMATASTLLSAVVTVLAVILGLYTMMLVGRMRGKHGVQAPAVTGAPEFERAFRMQMNTLEQFVLSLPVLWLATVYPKRSLGFLIGGVALLGLLVLSDYRNRPCVAGYGRLRVGSASKILYGTHDTQAQSARFM